MNLSKTERTYKKRLFAYLKIKKHRTQKEYTAAIENTEFFKLRGFSGLYRCLKYAIPRLSKTMMDFAQAAADTAMALKRYSDSIKLSEEISYENDENE